MAEHLHIVCPHCAATNRLNTEALILVLIFALWQIPHFYAIAIYRLDDYAAAAIPVLPIERGVPAAKKRIIAYIVAFMVAALMLNIAGYAGNGYFVVALVLSLIWLSLAWTAHKASDDRRWARKLFVCSIVTIFLVSVMMSIDPTIHAAAGELVTDAS
ncbi:MAG: UbiA family prenyltransferase [Pseudolabrys sp.]